jgi:hypothetical protein
MQLQRKTSIIQEKIFMLILKIVINSPEVCFGIKRQYAEVGCRNIISFSYKNALCRFCRKGKQFL